MDLVIIVIGILVGIILFISYTFLFGTAFREWNEGTSYQNDKSASNHVKTFAIGLLIFLILGLLLS